QPRSFSYLAGATPETLTVTLARSQQVHYTATSGGTISGSVPSDTFVAEGTPVTLTATDTSVVRAFQGWAGDTVTKNLSITLPMGLALGGAGSCGDGGSGPVAGVLTVSLATPNAGADGAILFSVSGPQALSSVTAGPGLRVFAQPLSTLTRFAVTGTLTNGAV